MKRIKQCSLAFSVFALALLSTVFLQSSSVSAASDYDTAYQTVPDIFIRTNNQSSNYDVAIGTQWRSIIVDKIAPEPFTTVRYYTDQNNSCSPVGTPCGNSALAVADLQTMDYELSGLSVSQGQMGETYKVVNICYRVNQPLNMQWAFTSVTVQNYTRCIYIDTNSANGWINIRPYTITQANLISTAAVNTKNLFCANCNPNYPAGYAGQSVQETWAPPGADGELVPDYSWTVSTTGELNVKYMNNLPHFFTGTANVVIEKMNDNWDGLDENLTSITENPAGWMDSKYTLPGAGYYMVRIDHNQQLDEPPWPTDSNFSVKQRWIQFYWDGSSAIQGTTVGCIDDICNPHRSDNNPVVSIFSSLDNIETFGLTAFVTAPISFLQTLPAKVSSCSPITFPLMGKTVSLECLSARYWSWSSTVMTIITTIWTGSVAYIVGLSIFRIIKDINSPHKDQIETVKL